MGAESEIQAAKWMVVEAVEAPGMMLLTQGQVGPDLGGPPLNLGKNRRPADLNTILRNSFTSTTYIQQGHSFS